MMRSEWTLANRFLQAQFDATTGNLLSLKSSRAPNCIRRVFCQWMVDDQWFSENCEHPNAQRPIVLDVQAARHGVSSIIRTEHAEITRRFELPEAGSLLQVRYTVRGFGKSAQLMSPAFPFIEFPNDLNDVTEDPVDLCFNGAELGGGRELPCWRVLFRHGHRAGLLVAARSKLQMSHIQIRQDGLQLFPHLMASYSSDFNLVGSPLAVAKGKHDEVRFEIGPWQQRNHQRILRAAKLGRPTLVGRSSRLRRVPTILNAPAGRAASATPPGKIFRAVDLVPQRQITDTFHPDKWLVTRADGPGKPRVLLANAGCCPPAFSLTPKERGAYRIFVGTGCGAILGFQVPGEPAPIYRNLGRLAFDSLLADQPMRELDFGVVDLDGRPLRFQTTRHRDWPSRIDYIRLQKLTARQSAKWRRQMSRPPGITLAGFADTYDIGYGYLDSLTPKPETFRANIWAHKRAGFRKIYWRIHGECADFPTRIGTMRPMIGRAHGVFEPSAKAYSRALQRFDLLQVARDAALEYGIELYGWIRFNAYYSGTRPEFFNQHLDYGDETEQGRRFHNKLCFAIEDVRRYIIGILVEAAAYGLDGLSLGFLRHPPVLQYHPIMTRAFERKFGKPPPRDPKNPDSNQIFTLPKSSPAHEQWYQFRAGYLTQFGRELRAALRAKGVTNTKISIWIRANHCLFDGIDVPAWVNEGLCDEVVADNYVPGAENVCEPRPDWKRMVQAKVPLLRGVGGFNAKYARANMRRILQEGYDGISTYESNEAVNEPGFLSVYDSLRLRRRETH